MVLDMDATLLAAHLEKELAAHTWKKGFGLHPLLAFVDHGEGQRIFGVAGRLVRTARRTILKISQTWPWAEIITTAHHQHRALSA